MSEIKNVDDLCHYFGIKDPGYVAPEVLEPRLAAKLYYRGDGHLRMRLLGKEGEPWPGLGVRIGDPEHSPARPTDILYPFESETLDRLIETMIAQGKESGPYIPAPVTDAARLVEQLGLPAGSDHKAVQAELAERGFTKVEFNWLMAGLGEQEVTGIVLGRLPDGRGAVALHFPFEVMAMDRVLLHHQTGR